MGVVYISGTNVNEETIRNGYAWQYRKYCKASFCRDWLILEEHARTAKIGLWRDNDPVPPCWAYRKDKRNGGRAKSNVVGGTAFIMVT